MLPPLFHITKIILLIILGDRKYRISGYLIKIVMFHEQGKESNPKNGFAWTFRDSNPGPTGYEPIALTN